MTMVHVGLPEESTEGIMPPADGSMEDDEEGPAAADASRGVDEIAGQPDTEEEADVEEERPEQKFHVRQRVFARDDKASGILYE